MFFRPSFELSMYGKTQAASLARVIISICVCSSLAHIKPKSFYPGPLRHRKSTETMQYPGMSRSRVRAIIEDELFIGYHCEDIFSRSFAARRSTYIISARSEPLPSEMLQPQNTHIDDDSTLSREAVVAAAYLIHSRQMSTTEAMDLIHRGTLRSRSDLSYTYISLLHPLADNWASPGHALFQQLVLFAQIYSPRRRLEYEYTLASFEDRTYGYW
ncbi:hypothetical protein EVG20_g9288 [Dentipellis fragilis]|uniref:Uncharacterized protein n=1 Tax=Dentipellis fragilis TaxID=205917 RepID=A0A4Y9Y0S1_9AGAM|nr:hypothetical protein EVG20_g9288 [Dentipellis fragilis]